jgi:SAM-dependent methyltransferase
MPLRDLLEHLARGARRPHSHDHHGHGHAHYGEAELLARADEFNHNAERHWREIAAEPEGRKHPLNKPFSTVKDTPSILYRLGLVLDALELGVGHTVLDFGAGSCWLSSCLNRLRCRTVAIDVSPSALDLGKELFALDPRHRMDLEPQFLVYDGHRIPLPDRSVDRVVCFDAFHHVPNQDEVLHEMFRVLKVGGRAVFAEPGEGHSHTGEAACEVERCGILENDFSLPDFLARAREAGFGDAVLKPHPDVDLSIGAERFFGFLDGRNRAYPLSLVRQQMRSFVVLALPKGKAVRDSRNPGLLRAEIVVPPEHRTLRGHGTVTISVPVRVRNAGDTVWLHEVDDVGGYVSLGAFLFSEERELLSRGLARAALPRPIAPGDAVDLELAIPLPPQPGRYFARLDIVDEYIAWGAHHGSATPELELLVEAYGDSRAPHQLCARIERRDGGAEIATRPGAPIELRLRITNIGDTLWLPAPSGARGTVSLGGHLHGEDGSLTIADFFRFPLPREVAPGDTVEVACVFPSPPTPGRFELRIDLVAEGLFWFVNHGSAILPIPVEVSDETPDSANPGVLAARIELLERGPLVARPGGRCQLSVRVFNTGNTIWLHGTRRSRGEVGLGGHLRDATGEMVAPDFFRASLPRSVQPGDSLELHAEITAPTAAGTYRLELDIVDEDIVWFGQKGSATVQIELRIS